MSALRLNPVKPTFHSQPVIWPGEQRLVSVLGIWSQVFLRGCSQITLTRPGVDKVKPKGWFKYSLLID